MPGFVTHLPTDALITRLSVDAAVRLLISSETHDTWEVVLNTPFTVEDGQGEREVAPSDVSAEAWTVIHHLLWAHVQRIEVSDDGALLVRTRDAAVHSRPHAEYEAWELLSGQG